MCDFASGLIDVDCETFYCADLESHSGTYNNLKLNAGSYREFEWLRDDDGKSLFVRLDPDADKKLDRNENYYKACIISKFKTRVEFIHWSIPNLLVLKISLLMPYVKFDIDGKILIATTDYSRGCAALTKLDTPNAQTVDVRGCARLTNLDAPNARGVYASWCVALTKLYAPNARCVSASWCAALIKLDAPNAQTVDVSGCAAMTKLNAPNAICVYASECAALTKLDAPNAQTVDVRGCDKLNRE